MQVLQQPTEIGQHTQIRFNQGQALLHLAGMYPSLQDVILELVQNALDNDVRATRIAIVVNFRTRHLAVRDNGAGVSVKRFNVALASVAEPGRKGEGSLGQFGIGLISPLGKCDRFTFTSCPAPHSDSFQEWMFNTDRIIKQKENLEIPLRFRPDLTLRETVSQGKTRVPWRSEMSLIGFTTDKFVSRIAFDQLIGAIQGRYAAVMRENKTVISIEITDSKGKTERRSNITAREFQGQALPEVVIYREDSGHTTFHLFVAPKKGKSRGGRVVLGVAGRPFRFPFHYFASSTRGLLGEEVAAALTSGLFEGEIISEKAELHPTRQALVKNDAFAGLACAIEEWFNKHGSSHLEELRESRQEQRLQDLGLRSMKVLEELLQDPANRTLLDVIRSFQRGTISSGQREVLGKKVRVVGEQERPSLLVDQKPWEPHPDDPITDPDQLENRVLKKPRTPLTVAGPRGRQRKLVRDANFGLQFAHEAMEGSNDLWQLEVGQGVLIFNIRHPLWIACDERDNTLMKLQECVAMQALTLHLMPEHLRVCQRQAFDEFTPALVSWILNSDRVRGKASASNSSQTK